MLSSTATLAAEQWRLMQDGGAPERGLGRRMVDLRGQLSNLREEVKRLFDLYPD